MSAYPGYIKVNLPSDHEHFINGNGEGVWVMVEPDVEKLSNEDYNGGIFKGTLDNDSLYYPLLKCGQVIPFTMRGSNRAVAIYQGFLDNLEMITESELNDLFKKISESSQIIYRNDL